MDERYLYKAKRIDSGKWAHGYLFCIWGHAYICWGAINDVPDMDEVDPSTICQCTGLIDKNGELIWENDIAYARCNGLSGYGVIKYENGCFVLVDKKRNRTYCLFGEWKFRVDGNIFDNKDLLESEE